MNNKPTLQQSSKKTWSSNGTTDHINAGSLQRIADALETISNNFTVIARERDRYERLYRKAASDRRELREKLASERKQ